VVTAQDTFAEPLPTLLGGCCSAVTDQPRWYAVYTYARHEKAIALHFGERGIDHFLPLYTTVQKWNKKNAKVLLPLFPGYVFVWTAPQQRYHALAVPGVVHYVGTSKAPSEIPAQEIELLRDAIRRGKRVEPHPYLAPGSRARIASGPMSGFLGVVLRTSAGCRVVVSVDMIMRSVAVEVDSSVLEVA
jgi:transcription antitermination factor NusG